MTLVAPFATILSAETLPTDPVRSFFFIVPYPMTTTSSSSEKSSLITISTTVPVMGTSWVFMPIYLASRVFAVLGTDNEYFPSKSVIVPVVEPFTETETPIKVSPFESVTVPDIPTCCANALCHENRKNKAHITDNVFTIVFCMVWLKLRSLRSNNLIYKVNLLQ